MRTSVNIWTLTFTRTPRNYPFHLRPEPLALLYSPLGFFDIFHKLILSLLYPRQRHLAETEGTITDTKLLLMVTANVSEHAKIMCNNANNQIISNSPAVTFYSLGFNSKSLKVNLTRPPHRPRFNPRMPSRGRFCSCRYDPCNKVSSYTIAKKLHKGFPNYHRGGYAAGTGTYPADPLPGDP